MNIEIRPVTVDDHESIARLSGQLGYSISVEETLKNINSIINSSNDVALVALIEGNIAGWIQVFYTVRMESAPFCEIAGLVVDAEYRGNGLGKVLIDATKEWCKAKGVSTLRVRSNVKRADAHRFYTKAGSIELKEQKVFEIRLMPQRH